MTLSLARIHRHLSRLVLALAFLFLAVQLGFALSAYAWQAGAALTFPYSIDYGEGPILDQTVRLAHFHNIYRPTLAAPPYTVSNYPPLFILLQAPFERVFGAAFWYGRALSVVGMLAAALSLALTLYELSGNREAAAAAGLMLLAVPYVQHWSLFDRVDSLALGLSWMGLYCAVRWGSRAKHAPVLPLPVTFWLAVGLLTAAIYTRQTYALAAPFAASFWLLFGGQGIFRQRLRRALLLGGSVAVVSLGLFAILNLLTRGGFFLNIVTANVNAFHWSTVDFFYKDFRAKFMTLIVIAGGFFVLERWFKPQRTRTWALAMPYLLAAGAGSLTIGKEGSSYNYLYEVSAALVFAGGAALAWVSSFRAGWKNWAAAALAVALGAQTAVWVGWTAEKFTPYLTYRLNNRAGYAELERLAHNAAGVVLADENMGLIPLAGKRLYLQPFEFKQLSDAGVWDQSALLADISARKFGLILWYQPPGERSIEARWTAAQIEAVRSSYHLAGKIADVYVYVPSGP